MKNKIISIIGTVLLLSGSVSAQVLPVPAVKQSEAIVLSGATIHTGTGEVIENGVIAFNNVTITAIGEAGQVTLPGDAKRVDVSGKHIYPGLILMN